MTPDAQDTSKMQDLWKLWRRPLRMTESLLLRYGVPGVLTAVAVFITNSRSLLQDTPYFIFLGATVLSALYGGLGPAFLSTGLNALVIRLLYIQPQFTLYHQGNTDDAERMVWFVLVSMMAASLIAALRRERNLLRDSEERYRTLAETASDAIVVIDHEGTILFVNPVAEKLFQLSGHQLLGRNLSALLPDEPYGRYMSEMRRHLDTRRKPVALELPAAGAGARGILLEMSFSPFTRHGKNLFAALLRDITGRNAAEQES